MPIKLRVLSNLLVIGRLPQNALRRVVRPVRANAASGALPATIVFAMIPRALKLGSLPVVIPSFIVGLAAVYGLDPFVHRGQWLGQHSGEAARVKRFHTRRVHLERFSQKSPHGPTIRIDP